MPPATINTYSTYLGRYLDSLVSIFGPETMYNPYLRYVVVVLGMITLRVFRSTLPNASGPSESP